VGEVYGQGDGPANTLGGLGWLHARFSDADVPDDGLVTDVYDGAMIITTPRLRLRCWEESDRDAFAAMHADPAVMQDYGGPISRQASDAKLERYAMAYRQYGFCRWGVESRDGDFLGYAGIMPSRPGHPLGPHSEIGWRLVRHAWRHGYATEAARAALDDGFVRVGLAEVVAYTAADNLRSQAVMERLHMRRDPSRDFTADYDSIKGWRGLVWVARCAPGDFLNVAGELQVLGSSGRCQGCFTPST
jgi:RimJ/RimL family protein N-acetyltransferase